MTESAEIAGRRKSPACSNPWCGPEAHRLCIHCSPPATRSPRITNRNGIRDQNEQSFQPHGFAFRAGQRVCKIKGSSWQGKIVGFYSTNLTPIGYAIESEREPGSVQIYPESALMAVKS